MTLVGVSYNDPEYGRKWRELHRDRLQAERKIKYEEFWKPRRIRRSYWINKYKVAKGCYDCGYNLHAFALDFDHDSPSSKRFTISHRLDRGTLKSLVSEIRKCTIRCANCHRIRTYKERHFDRIP